MLIRLKQSVRSVFFGICIFISVACVASKTTPTIQSSLPSKSEIPSTSHPELTQDQFRSLASLERVDDYPLYVMHYYANYDSRQTDTSGLNRKSMSIYQDGSQSSVNNWGCSLFAALGDPKHLLFGRNFDWRFSPALILYTYPTGGNASVSLVDIEYLVAEQAANLLDLPFEQRLPLLSAPEWPFDGMNECGLAIGMAAVPSGGVNTPDPKKPNIGSLELIREILDHTCTVDEAIEIMGDFNIVWDGSPELHYLIADNIGQAVLVEYYQGNMHVIPNQEPWHHATNFLLRDRIDAPQGVCSRYDSITEKMMDNSGKLTTKQAMTLLSEVSQESTQWSIIYQLSSGEFQIAVGKDYMHPHTFQLDMRK